MNVELLTEHYLEFLSLKGGCKGLSESTFVKMPHCWNSHAAAHMLVKMKFQLFPRSACQIDKKVCAEHLTIKYIFY